MYFHFEEEPYIAIIGDIKASRTSGDRNALQSRLKQILSEINREYQKDIAAKFTITLGDEFQGLLLAGSNTIEIISRIERYLWPIRLRFGIGIGRITTEIDIERAIGADGPAFYLARSAIEYLKKNEKKNQAVESDIRIEAEGTNRETTDLLNTILFLVTAIIAEWSDRQREHIWSMLTHKETQAELAQRLNVRQPAVQKTLSKGHYYAYREAMDTVGRALSEIRRKDV
jgi:hypothetical protein